VFIEIAPLFFTFEEWACVFPDAAQALDYEFINRSVERFREHHSAPSRPISPVRSIGIYWHGFEQLRLSDVIPGLKHWSDRAALQWVRFFEGSDKLSLLGYKKWKSRMRCHSEKPKIIAWARYTREGDTHCLKF
jgi:hypothetical protein